MEDKNLIVNTHHAFLNTDIVLSSRVCPVTVFDKLSGEEYVVNDKPLVTKLCAGKHELYSKELDEEIVVEVEDAMKFGGGRIAKAKAFVFDENPWVFVVTKDRLYATNTKTGECEIEHNICPSEIRGYGNYHGAVCDYFLFKTEDDYSIYNVSSGKHIIQFTDYIYSNSHLVIFKKDEAVVVYNYRDEKVGSPIRIYPKYEKYGGRQKNRQIMVTIITRTREELVEQLDLYNVPHDEYFDRLVDLIIKFDASYGLLRKSEDDEGNECGMQWGCIEYYNKDK